MSDSANIIYLVLLLILVGGGLFTRTSLLVMTRFLLVWAVIIVLIMAGFGLYKRHISAPRLVDGQAAIAIPLNPFEGGFAIDVHLNDRPVRMLVDTGANKVMLRYEDARKAGIDLDALDFNIELSTANGEGLAAIARLEKIAFGDIEFRDVETLIAPEGKLNISLIGMNLIRQFASTTVAEDKLLITF